MNCKLTAFACIKRAENPANESGACRVWCGDQSACPSNDQKLDAELVERYLSKLAQVPDDVSFQSMGWTMTPELLEAVRRYKALAASPVQGAASAPACPNAAHMGEHACANRSQCWESCGELGKSAEHCKVAAASAISSSTAPEGQWMGDTAASATADVLAKAFANNDAHAEREAKANQAFAASATDQGTPGERPPPELTWLYTHCRAIGMDCKSISGKWEHDIALYTMNLTNENRDLRAALAERAQAAQPSGAVARVVSVTPGMGRIEIHFGGDVPEWADIGNTVFLATPAPEQEAAPEIRYQVKQHGWASMWMDASKAEFDACDTEKRVVHLAAPVEQEAAQVVAKAEPTHAIAVKVERNRVWIVKGAQSFMLAYEADEGDTPKEIQWYADQLRAALSSITPCVKSDGAQVVPLGYVSKATMECLKLGTSLMAAILTNNSVSGVDCAIYGCATATNTNQPEGAGESQ